jgi:hypothetical protein
VQADVQTLAAYAIVISSILQAFLIISSDWDQLIFGLLLPLSPPPFAGKSPLLAESSMHTFRGNPTLSLCGEEITLQEDLMAAQQTSPRSSQSITGAILLALGFLILFANLDGVAGQITSAVGTSAEPAQGVLPALVLATLHVLQDYAFDRTGFLSVLLQFLVPCWPLILIIIGAVLLRDAFWGRFAAYKAGAGSSAMGER